MDKGQEFAKNLLMKYGWEQGKGLGKNEDGMINPIRPTLKLNTLGVGYDAGEEFSYHWWNHTFNEAARKLVVNNSEEKVTISLAAPSTEITTRRLKRRRNGEPYGNFVQSGTLLNDCIVGSNATNEDKMTDEEDLDLSIRLTDEQLFAKCGKLTGHKAARHGHKLSGKLRRLQKQEEELLAKQKMPDRLIVSKRSHGKCTKETLIK